MILITKNIFGKIERFTRASRRYRTTLYLYAAIHALSPHSYRVTFCKRGNGRIFYTKGKFTTEKAAIRAAYAFVELEERLP